MADRSGLDRILDILSRLNNGETLSVSKIAEEYQVSERTVRRDFEAIRSRYPETLTKKGDSYKAYSRFLLDKVLCGKDLARLANIVNIFGETEIDSSISDEVRDIVRKTKEIYSFDRRDFENIDNVAVIKEIESAIQFRKKILVIYSVRKRKEILVKPYKILFLNENFYLACVGENSPKNFMLLRISFVDEVFSDGTTFIRDPEIVKFISKIQTPWSRFGEEEKEVILRVSSKIKRHFLKKRFLKSQNVLEECDNGDILVSYKVFGYGEIKDFVIKWLPGVNIENDERLKEIVRGELLRKMDAVE